jgi:hypothetical protein
MDSLGETRMNFAPQVLTELFADYRAEWPQPYFASLFVPPPYFRKLEVARPCLLIGGRGTGKTTALKSLRFDATETRQRSRSTVDARPEYLGIYVRINKNRVRAFNAQEIEEQIRVRAFAHYINVSVSQELCRLALWLETNKDAATAPIDLSQVADAFGIPGLSDSRAVLHALDKALLVLELWINNGGRGEQPIFSVAEAPLRQFMLALDASGTLNGRHVYCCIDEYENLSPIQPQYLCQTLGATAVVQDWHQTRWAAYAGHH